VGLVERLLRAAPPGGELAHVVRLVGDQQRGRLGATPAVHRGPGGERGVGDGDAVAIARLGPAEFGRLGSRSIP
jgi:hypothetical protein